MSETPQQDVMTVPCPFCHAQPGEPCHNMGGKHKGEIILYQRQPTAHQSRYYALAKVQDEGEEPSSRA